MTMVITLRMSARRPIKSIANSTKLFLKEDVADTTADVLEQFAEIQNQNLTTSTLDNFSRILSVLRDGKKKVLEASSPDKNCGCSVQSKKSANWKRSFLGIS